MEIDEKLLKNICAFFDENPNLFCFFADPASDTIISAFNRRQIARRTVEPEGEVREALNFKTGKKARGQMTMKFASMMHSIAKDIVDQGMLKQLNLEKGRKKTKTKTQDG